MTTLFWTGWLRQCFLTAAVSIATCAADPAETYAQDVSAADRTVSQDLLLPAEDGWQTYVNGRFGMTLSYPATLFTPSQRPQNGDGRHFIGEDARLETFGWVNEAQEGPASLKSRLIGSEGYDNLTKSEATGSWLVLSGTRGTNVIFERYMFVGDTIQAFGMEYPAALRTLYDPILKSIDATFFPGGAIVSSDGADQTDLCPPDLLCSPQVDAPALTTGPTARITPAAKGYGGNVNALHLGHRARDEDEHEHHREDEEDDDEDEDEEEEEEEED